jgi:hypothetical protein
VPDPGEVAATGDEPPVDDELLLLLLPPQAATAPHTATTAAIVPMRLRIMHTPFSIDRSPPTRPLPQQAIERQGGVGTAIRRRTGNHEERASS